MNIAERIRSILPAGIVSCWLPGSRAQAPGYATGEEVLTDGGMEVWTSATNLTNWNEQLAGTSTVNREATIKMGGSYSCRMDIDADNNYAVVSQSVTVVPGSRYRASFWCRASAADKVLRAEIAVNTAAGMLYLQTDGTFDNYSNPGRGTYWVEATVGTTWIQRQIDLIVPEDSDTTLVFTVTRSTAASASLYIDNASLAPLTEVGQGGAPGRATDIIRDNHGQAHGLVIPEVPAHGYCKEILADGGLEVWTSSVDLTHWIEGLTGSSTVTQESVVTRKGTGLSARMDIDSSNNYAYIYQVVAIQDGKRYRLSFWYKTDVNKSTCVWLSDGTGSVYLGKDGSFSAGWKSLASHAGIAGGGTWVKGSVDFTVPSGYTGWNLFLNSGGYYDASSSAVYFDDISILEFQETLGPELLTDGGLEDWSSATNLTNWLESLYGTATVNREASVIHSGTYAARIDAPAVDDYGQFYQSINPSSTERRLRISFWYRVSSQGNLKTYIFTDIGGVTYFLQHNGTWATSPSYYEDGTLISVTWAYYTRDFTLDPRITGAISVGFFNSEDSTSAYIDDASIKEIFIPPIETDLGWTFDGRDAYIQVPTKPIFQQAQMTLGCWIQDLSQVGAYSALLLVGNGGSASQYSYMLAANASSLALLISDGSNEQLISSVFTWGSKKWHFACGRADGQYLRLFIDGVEASPVAQTVTPGGTNLPVTIGRELNSSGFSGAIALPFIINRALSSQEIANIYNATKGFFSPRG